MLKKIPFSEILAVLALLLKISETVNKQVPGLMPPSIAELLPYLSLIFLITSFLTWLISSNKKLSKLDDVVCQLDEVKQELDRLENALAEKSKTNAELEEIFRFRPDRINADNMRNVWTALLWRIQDSYCATNYIKDTDIYLRGYAESAFAIQVTKIKVQHVNIKKVFIVQDDSDLQKMQTVFKSQHDSGIQVKYIFLNAIHADPSLNAMASRLATIDFGLIDTRIALLWFLKEDRSVDGGKILLGEQELALYKDFFNALFMEATKYS